MIEEAIYQILSTDAALVSVVGDRIYPRVKTGRGHAPWVVYTKVTGTPSVTISAADGQRSSTIQVDVYADDPTDCGHYAKLVQAALHKYTGTVAGIAIHYILQQSDRPDYDYEANLYRVVSEFLVKHN